MKRIQIIFVVLVILWAGCSTNARALTIMFTDRSAWQMALAGIGYSVTNIDFENTTNSAGDLSQNWTVTAGDVVFGLAKCR